MISAFALLAGAMAVGLLLPGVLRRLHRTMVDPRVLLSAWLLSIVGVLSGVAIAVILLLIPDHRPASNLLTLIHQCWITVSHGATPRVEEFVGVLGGLAFLGVALRFAVIAAQTVRRRSRASQKHLTTLRIAARVDGGTLWLDHDRPLAFSLGGPVPAIVATEGLNRYLSSAEVAAVLEHERAHLRGRHHLLITWVDALAVAIPFVRLFRQAPAAVRELVELAADVAAVRACGADTVHSALIGVCRDGSPTDALAMARDGVELRLARLCGGIAPAGRIRTNLACGLTAAAAVALPIWTGIWVLLSIALVSCPIFR
ncbi:M56 family metallopeptidase [Kibdelosporangium philippinense]|uniref:M56 family metallopeptidase n=1 Tax=Kibdelosporangium philippinense TaxID=211113 RepID=A0ABS8ZAY8_9PSEU|nr:M56 family metallopeptidase [Kibdelosporangium philippinense]MCE7004582.1 M56 family metallopeptidase [Kibdelosporangium philippinense]